MMGWQGQKERKENKRSHKIKEDNKKENAAMFSEWGPMSLTWKVWYMGKPDPNTLESIFLICAVDLLFNKVSLLL